MIFKHVPSIVALLLGIVFCAEAGVIRKSSGNAATSVALGAPANIDRDDFQKTTISAANTISALGKDFQKRMARIHEEFGADSSSHNSRMRQVTQRYEKSISAARLLLSPTDRTSDEWDSGLEDLKAHHDKIEAGLDEKIDILKDEYAAIKNASIAAKEEAERYISQVENGIAILQARVDARWMEINEGHKSMYESATKAVAEASEQGEVKLRDLYANEGSMEPEAFKVSVTELKKELELQMELLNKRLMAVKEAMQQSQLAEATERAWLKSICDRGLAQAKEAASNSFEYWQKISTDARLAVKAAEAERKAARALADEQIAAYKEAENTETDASA